MNVTMEKQNFIRTLSYRQKHIIAAVSILLLITAALAYIYFTQEQKPDPASEKIIREAAVAQLNKNPSELTDEDFANITELNFNKTRQPLESVIINNTTLGSRNGTKLSDIQLLEKFPNLERLYFSMIYYPESKIPKWKKIFAKLGITDLQDRLCIDLSPLRNLSNLNELYFDISPIKNIKPLSNLTNLKKLSLNGTYVTNLVPVRGLINLEFLSLVNTPVSNLEPIKGLNNLKVLYIANTRITNLEPIKGLKNLNSLMLDGTNVTNLEPIKNLINLQLLFLHDCKNITDEQVEDLQKALPNLKIER